MKFPQFSAACMEYQDKLKLIKHAQQHHEPNHGSVSVAIEHKGSNIDPQSSSEAPRSSISDLKSSDKDVPSSGEAPRCTNGSIKAALSTDQSSRSLDQSKAFSDIGDLVQADDSSGQPNGSRDVFPFFQLSAELRDLIYERAFEFKRKLPSQHRIRLRVRHSAQVNLLLVSRQFQREYAERARRHTTLVIVDRDDFLGQTLHLPAPPIRHVTRLEIYLALACSDHCHSQSPGCRVKRELRMHRRWISHLIADMRHLERVDLRVHLDPHERVSHCESVLGREQYRLTNLEGLTDVRVYHCEYDIGMSGWNFMRKRRLISEWDDRMRELKEVPPSIPSNEEQKSPKEGDEETVKTDDLMSAMELDSAA